MAHQYKKNKGQNKHNSLDFHLEIIKKIDKLLADHDQVATSSESFRGPPIIPLQPPSPIEPRTPLNKALSHQEIAWDVPPESSLTTARNMPEEFKTELTVEPEFRFITSQEFADTISHMRSPSEERIEIIDLPALSEEMIPGQKTITFTQIKHLDEDESYIKENIFSEDHRHKKIEIIDAHAFQDAEESEHTGQDDKKSQVFFLNRKEDTYKKQKKLDVEESYIPIDFDQRSKELKEKLQREQEKRQQIEKIINQLESERQKLEKLQHEKSALEKKKPVKEKEKKFSKKPSEPIGSKHDLRKQAKEQKRLQRLKIRQARIEEKRRKKEEKQALKLKQKQQRLQRKGKHVQHTQRQNDINDVVLKSEAEYVEPLEIDEDLQKVLLLTDTLLAELPEEILNQFIHSKEFELYERVLNKYKVK
jgi:hypothetical protein